MPARSCLSPRAAVALLAMAVVAASCTGPSGREGASQADDGSLDVMAAASLTEAFGDMAEVFRERHPGITVRFDFAGSSTLARRLLDGAPADVFVSADPADMARVTEAGRARAPGTIARNRLAIVVPTGNPAGIGHLADLARPGVVVVLCSPEVPCGRLAASALRRAGVEVRPASLEADVKAVVAKVTLGEADAGIVYATDVRAARGQAGGVGIAGAVDAAVSAEYQMAVTTGAANHRLAQAWVDLVTSAGGRRVLEARGFLPP